MNGNKNGTANRNRTYRNFKIAPTTRAIRSALAVSATMLALSGSGAALAGTCAVTGLVEVTCNGVFTDDVTNTVPVINLVPDLTLVVGDDGTTTVDPAAGVSGISSTWGGDATVINYAEINTTDAAGIYMYSNETATVENNGSIYSYGGGADANGAVVVGYYDTSVTNTGDITAQAATASTYNATGVYAYSIDGVTSVDNSGTIAGNAYDGDGIGVLAIGYYGVSVNNDGDVSGSSFNGGAAGIIAVSYYGGASVTNGGTVEAYTLTGDSYGIEAEAKYGDVSVDNSGGVYVGGEGTSLGVLAIGVYGNVSVDNSGTIETTSTTDVSYGVIASGKYDGYTTSIDSSGSVTVYGYAGAAGLVGTSVGDVYIDNSGTVDVTANAGYAIGIAASSTDGYAYVDNSGSVSAVSTGYYAAIGIIAQAAYNVGVTNSGSVYASGYYSADGILANSYVGTASVTTTTGSYTGAVSKYDSTGITATGDLGATVANGGDIYTYAGGYAFFSGGSFYSTGISAYSQDGDASVSNSGNVDVNAYGITLGGQVVATGITATSYNYNASVDNTGSVDVYAGGYTYNGVSATGVYVASYWGDATFTGTGDITVLAYGYGYNNGVDAIGLAVYSYDGNASVTNSGDITVTATNYGGQPAYHGASATGITAYTYNGDTTIDNAGSVTVTANTSYLNYYGGSAVGIYGGSYFGEVSITNSGDVSAVVNGGYNVGYYANNTAVGIQGTSYDGDVTVTNSGSVNAAVNYGISTGKYANSATGIDVYSYNGSVVVDSSGTITASAYAGSATGVLAFSYNYDATVTNSGDITVTADYGATGVYAHSKYGDVAITNSGDINVSSNYSGATGVYAYNKYGDSVTINNSGTVTVDATYYYASANGIVATIYYGGTIDIDNSGTVSVTAYDTATGISANSKYSAYGDITIDNSGSIDATAVYTAVGISASTKYGNEGVIDINNSGDVTATATGVYNAYGVYGAAAGIVAQGYYGVNVENSGAITVSSYTASYGVIAQSIFDDVTVDNSGTIDVYAGSGYFYAPIAYGVIATNVYGDVGVTNSGLIEVNATSFQTLLGDITSVGVLATTNGFYGDVYVGNSGTIDASATSYSLYYGPTATGVQAYAKYGEVFVANTGSISATARSDFDEQFGAATATGVYAVGINGYNVEVYNGGSISADASAYYGPATATGVYALSVYGDITIYNEGGISASATSGDYSAYSIAQATGVNALGAYLGNVDVLNFNSIDATATTGYGAEYSSALAVGVNAESPYGDVFVYNGGSVSATATASYGYDNQADAYGIVTYAYDGDIQIVNNADVSATASSDGIAGYANATGISALIGYYGYGALNIYNNGTVTATAEDHATGILAQSYGSNVVPSYGGNVYVGNSGTIEASAVGGYYSEAAGIRAEGHGVVVYNEGAISATADGLYGSLAFGVYESAYDLEFTNAGTIEASANGDYGIAAGVLLQGYYGFSAFNSGSISAEGTERAYGLVAYSSTGNVAVYNEGDISATSDYLAVGVAIISSDYYGYVYNSGTISAEGGAYSVAIWSEGYSYDEIRNYGTINGAIWSGDLDDYLYIGEGGVWNPGTTPSDFGYGDDAIVNYGTINMEGSTIDLGYHAVNGNYFYNFGVINVSGDENYINMGSGIALVPSLNPNAFYNYGTIDFQDGNPDDVLYITGDFAGDGDINVDVSGLDGLSDVLYIDGSVVAGTVNTINVDLLDLPETIESLIPIVYVTGVSTSGEFVLGDVSFDDVNTFVTLDFDIVADIDATNATPDVFNLGIEISGLSDPGTLAASIAPSVQSLMNSEVGTWRQRMGVIDSFNKGGVALWARVFTDKGSFTPEHVAGNFGNGGNFDWDQKNTGVEGGVDFAVTDEFSLGLLVATSDADTHLDEPGTGHADISADTWGIYGTWISPNGFYLDASYRWMSFDVDLDSVAGSMETSGDAEAFNIEAGYAWTLEGGLKIEPQLQYTKTSVDNLDVLVTTTGMTFTSEGGDSSRGRLGVAIRKSFGEADNGWLWTPYATLSAVREFDGENGYAINDTFFGETNVEGTSALLELGFTARHQGWAIYGGLNWQDGGAVNSFFGGQLGVRYTFGGPAPAAPVAPPPAKTCADLDDDGDGVNNCDDKCLSSTAGQAVGPDGCPVPLTIDLKGVNFDFDKATLRPDAVAILDEAVAILGKYPDLKVEVAGHTDSIGSEQYNQGLSERRAKTVWDYLAAHGVDAGRMVGPNGYGETRPIAPNTNEDGSDNPEGRAKNRRTELNVQN